MVKFIVYHVWYILFDRVIKNYSSRLPSFIASCLAAITHGFILDLLLIPCCLFARYCATAVVTMMTFLSFGKASFFCFKPLSSSIIILFSIKDVVALPIKNCLLLNTALWNGIVVLTPSIMNSPKALFILAIASCLVFP